MGSAGGEDEAGEDEDEAGEDEDEAGEEKAGKEELGKDEVGLWRLPLPKSAASSDWHSSPVGCSKHKYMVLDREAIVI